MIFASVNGLVKMHCNQKDIIALYILIYSGEILYCFVTSWWYVDGPTIKCTVYYQC